MMHLNNTIHAALLFAQNGAGAALLQVLTLVLPLLLLYYFLIRRPEQQWRSQRQAMLERLKKDDQVLTRGGIYGVVTNVQREANRVTLRVDENTGAKLQIALGAIEQIFSETPADQPAKT